VTNGLRLRLTFFKTEGGREPVREWLLSLPREERQVIGTDLLDVQYSWPLGMPLVRKLDADLWEVRSNLGDRIGRVLFTVEEATLVALHGFIKKSQKTSAAELATARRRLAQFKEQAS